MRTLLAAALMALTATSYLAGFSAVAQAQTLDRFGAYAHVTELAQEARHKANQVCWEMHRYHRQQPAFSETYRNAKEIYTAAGYVGELSTNHGDRERVRENAQVMEQLFIRVRSDVLSWGPDEGALHALRGKVTELGDAIGHLMHDAGARPAEEKVDETGAPPRTIRSDGLPVAPRITYRRQQLRKRLGMDRPVRP